MRRPSSFSDIVGHNWLVEYLTSHLSRGTLPQFIILEGPEGLGKTSLADLLAVNLVYGLEDSEEKKEAIKTVINNNGSNDYIKRYKCSVDGGKEVAKDILSEMTNSFMLSHKKVLICDECHNFVDAAQDVFLSDTEFMKDDVYLLMLTTDVYRLKASLKSRAVQLHLYPLKQSDMMSVLRREVEERHLNVQNVEATLQLICECSECKPRTGLSILKAFADGDSVSSNTIREMIGVLDISDVLPILEALSSSMTFGINYITTMKINESIVDLVAECFKIKTGSPSYKVQLNQVQEIRARLQNVTVEQLALFLHGITKQPTVSQNSLLNAFITAHNTFSLLGEKSTDYVLKQELDQKTEVGSTAVLPTAGVKAPSIEELLANSELIEGGK